MDMVRLRQRKPSRPVRPRRRKKVAEDLARFVNGDAEFYSCDAKEG